MRPDKQNLPERDDLRRRGNALWYYEERGNGRTYFRLTLLAWAFFIIPTVLAVLGLTSLYFYNSLTPSPEPDVTIRPRDTSADASSSNLLKRASSAPSPPRVGARTNINSGNSTASPQPVRNGNGQ